MIFSTKHRIKAIDARFNSRSATQTDATARANECLDVIYKMITEASLEGKRVVYYPFHRLNVEDKVDQELRSEILKELKDDGYVYTYTESPASSSRPLEAISW